MVAIPNFMAHHCHVEGSFVTQNENQSFLMYPTFQLKNPLAFVFWLKFELVQRASLLFFKFTSFLFFFCFTL